jgi:hypothetical protein
MASSPDRTKWKTMAAEDRIAAVNTLLVLHPRFRDAVNLLKRCHEDSRRSAEPLCGALLGNSGVGKTSVIDHYRRSFPVEETESATRQRVLTVTLQPNAKPKGIAADILFALRDPAWSVGTVPTLTNRAVSLLDHCGVELIILDEFHHLFDSERARVMTQAAQWLKVLIVNTRIPVVVSGMPEATYVLNAEHTERRFKDRLVFRCFNWRTQPGRREFRGMLRKLDDAIPLLKSSGLSDPDVAGRIYLACRGVPDYLMTLVRGAVREAIERGSEIIELPDLARVYESRLSHQRILAEQNNPFVGALDSTLLDRVQSADANRVATTGLTPRSAQRRKQARNTLD